MKPGVRARFFTKFKARKKHFDAGLYRKSKKKDEYEQLKRWREINNDYKTQVIGVYHVEDVGLVTGLAEAERITCSFTGKPPEFVHWETIDGETEDDVIVLTMPDDELCNLEEE